MACEYEILGFRHVNIVNPLGGFMGAQEVTWTTKGSGIQKTNIPGDEFDAARTRQLIEPICETIQSLLGKNT